MTATKRASVMRVISKGVPEKRRTDGKNSSMDGPWKVPLAAARGCSRVTALANSAIS
jgi:hypothetical protein